MRDTASDTDPNLTTLLETAHHEPVFIHRDQQQIAVILSARYYDRLNGKSTREFLDFCDKMAAEAAANGLTRKNFRKFWIMPERVSFVPDTNVLVSRACFPNSLPAQAFKHAVLRSPRQ